MKAIVLTAYGDVNMLELRELPDPRAVRGAVVVRMAGASINPVDWKMRSGAARDHFPVDFPGVLGRDASGEVVEVGQDVSAFAVGDRVLGLVHGGYAELVSAPADSWAVMPEGLDLAEAGALPLALLTGAELLERAVDPGPGDTVLVTGAVGSVGRVAVHAAKLRGVKVWAGVRSSQLAEAETLEAHGVVGLDDVNAVAALPKLDAIADTVGGETLEKLFAQLKPGATIGSVLGKPPAAEARGFKVRALLAEPDRVLLTKYSQEVAAGRLILPIAAKLPLAQAREAQILAERKHPRGKVLLLGSLAAA